MSIEKVKISQKLGVFEKLSQFSDYWNPRVVGELNGQLVKLVKFQGEFIWHKHDIEDEMFLVISGEFKMHLRDKLIVLQQGDFIIIPKGIEHKPVADEEVHLMLIEPDTLLNTGDKENEFTKKTLNRL